jgi:hypothetical protein
MTRMNEKGIPHKGEEKMNGDLAFLILAPVIVINR